MAKKKRVSTLDQTDSKPKIKKLGVKPQGKICVKLDKAKSKSASRRAALRKRKTADRSLGKGKAVHSYKVSAQEYFPKHDTQPIRLPPHICEELGIPSYTYAARALPPFCSAVHYCHLNCDGVCEPPLPDVGDPNFLPNAVANPSPLPSEGSTTHRTPTDGVRAESLPLKFPGVFMFGMHWNDRESDILQFFHGLDVVDVFLIFTNKSSSGEAFVVFSNSAFADVAVQRDGQKMISGNSPVRVLPCSRQDYYNAVAAVLDDGLDSCDSPDNLMDVDNNNLKEHTDAAKVNAIADASQPEQPQGETTRLFDNDPDHRQLQGEAVCMSGKENSKPEHKEKGNSLSDNPHILKLFGPPYFYDTDFITGLFSEVDLSEDRIHYVLHPNGKATGEVFLEFLSQEDAKKALKKHKKIIGSRRLKIRPATVVDLQATNTEQRKKRVGHISVKESNNELQFPDGQGSLVKCNSEPMLLDSRCSLDKCNNELKLLHSPDIVKKSNNEPKFVDRHGSVKISKDELQFPGGHDSLEKCSNVPTLIDSHDSVKKSNNKTKLPEDHLQGKPKISEGNQKVYTEVIRMVNVPPSADKYDIIELFEEFELSPDRLHIVCQGNGIATGVVFVEFQSVEDAKKALSKPRIKIHSHCVFLFRSSKEEAIAMNGK